MKILLFPVCKLTSSTCAFVMIYYPNNYSVLLSLGPDLLFFCLIISCNLTGYKGSTIKQTELNLG